MSTYIFIDGAYLRRRHAEITCAWFKGEVEIDFRLVVSRLEGLCGASTWGTTDQPPPERTTFYYDCLDEERRDSESESTFGARIESQNELLRNIREVERCHIRLGALKGTKTRKQKEVDVLIAVDMMAHAARRNMSKAVLVAGDQDFRPAVEALVQLGVSVQIVGEEKTTSKELTWAASTYTKLTFDDFCRWTSDSLRSKYPPPQGGNYRPSSATGRSIKEGSLNGKKCSLFQSDNEYCIYLENFSPGGFRGTSEQHFRHADLERLELYLALSYSPIIWDKPNAPKGQV